MFLKSLDLLVTAIFRCVGHVATHRAKKGQNFEISTLGMVNYYSHGRSHFGRKWCHCVSFVLCVGPILAIVGLAFLISATHDARADKITNYNNAVEYWESPAAIGAFRSVTASTAWNITVANNQNTSVSVYTLSSRTFDMFSPASDHLSSDSVAVSTYSDYIHWEGNMTLDFSGKCSTDDGCITTDTIDMTFGNQSLQNNIFLNDIKTLTYTSRQMPQGSCSPGDVYKFGGCYSYSILTSICISIDQQSSEQKSWALSSNKGCGMKGADGPGYSRLRIFNSYLPKIKNIPVQVRVFRDPLVQFYLDNGVGATNFGLTQESKAWLGTIFIAVGGSIALLLTLSCVLFLRQVSKGQSHKPMYINDYHVGPEPNLNDYGGYTPYNPHAAPLVTAYDQQISPVAGYKPPPGQNPG